MEIHFTSLYNEQKEITNLKTKDNQNCHKIELYESLTTKELKVKHSSTLAGGAEAGRWRGLAARQQLEDQAVPHSHADNLGGTTGERDRLCNPGSSAGKMKPQNLWM